MALSLSQVVKEVEAQFPSPREYLANAFKPKVSSRDEFKDKIKGWLVGTNFDLLGMRYYKDTELETQRYRVSLVVYLLKKKERETTAIYCHKLVPMRLYHEQAIYGFMEPIPGYGDSLIGEYTENLLREDLTNFLFNLELSCECPTITHKREAAINYRRPPEAV